MRELDRIPCISMQKCQSCNFFLDQNWVPRPPNFGALAFNVFGSLHFCLSGVLMIEIWWLVPVFFLNKNGFAIRHFEARQLKLQSICWNLSIYNFCKHFVYSTWHSMIWHSIASWWQKWCGLPCSWCAQHCIYLFFLWSWGMWSWENTLWSTPKRLVCKQLVFCVIASHG